MLQSCMLYNTNNQGPTAGTSKLSRFRQKASYYWFWFLGKKRNK